MLPLKGVFIEERLRQLNELHVDIWHLHKKYYHLPEDGTEEEWEQLIDDYQALEKKYEQDPELSEICIQLIKAVVKTIDDRHFKGKEIA